MSETNPRPVVGSEERTWAAFCHVAAFAGAVFPVVGLIAGPLVVWLLKREEFPLVDDQGKESLNWQITVALVMLPLIGLIAVCYSAWLLWPLIYLVWLALFCIGVLDIALVVVAAIKANEGQAYRYPIALRLIQ